MAVGLIAFENTVTSTTVTIRFVAPTNFNSGTFHMQRMTYGSETTATAANGNNTLTLPFPNERYAIWVVSLDAAGDYLGISNVVFLDHRYYTTGDDFEIMWKTDNQTDYTSGNYYDIDAEYEHVVPNMTGQWFQWKMTGDMQNHKICIRNAQIESRMRGFPQSATKGS